MTTKIHMVTDKIGRPLRFILTPGQRADVTQAPALLKGLQAKHVLADRAYDSGSLRAIIANMGASPVIPCLSTRKIQIAYDRTIYKARNAIERTFNKLKHFRRFATRYDRRDTYFLAFIHIAAAMLWTR